MKLKARGASVFLRPPGPLDGAELHQLIHSCPPLDENSTYCNLLQCTHFSATSVVGAVDGELVAATTGYLIPDRPDTLFIWQVAVHESARGQALGKRMLQHILARPQCKSVSHLETTVTESNSASWAMFKAFARDNNATLQRRMQFERDWHLNGEHDSEHLVRIGPLPASEDRLADTFDNPLEDDSTLLQETGS